MDFTPIVKIVLCSWRTETKALILALPLLLTREEKPVSGSAQLPRLVPQEPTHSSWAPSDSDHRAPCWGHRSSHRTLTLQLRRETAPASLLLQN